MKSLILFTIIITFLVSGCTTFKPVEAGPTASIIFTNHSKLTGAYICQGDRKGTVDPWKNIKVSAEQPLFINYKVRLNFGSNRYCQAKMYINPKAGEKYYVQMMKNEAKNNKILELLYGKSYSSCWIAIDDNLINNSNNKFYPKFPLIKNKNSSCHTLSKEIEGKYQPIDISLWINEYMPSFQGVYIYDGQHYKLHSDLLSHKQKASTLSADFELCLKKLKARPEIKKDTKNHKKEMTACILSYKTPNGEPKWSRHIFLPSYGVYRY